MVLDRGAEDDRLTLPNSTMRKLHTYLYRPWCVVTPLRSSRLWWRCAGGDWKLSDRDCCPFLDVYTRIKNTHWILDTDNHRTYICHLRLRQFSNAVVLVVNMYQNISGHTSLSCSNDEITVYPVFSWFVTPGTEFASGGVSRKSTQWPQPSRTAARTFCTIEYSQSQVIWRRTYNLQLSSTK